MTRPDAEEPRGSRTPPRWAAWLLAGFAFVSGVLALVLAFRNQAHPRIESVDFAFLIALPASAVGLLLATRRPENTIGWLFLGIGAIGGLDGAAGQYALWSLTSPEPLPGVEWAAWLWNWPIQLVVPSGLLLVLILTFPTGRTASRWWSRVVWVGIVLSVFQAVAGILSDSPILISPEVPRVPNPTGVLRTGLLDVITGVALAGAGITLVTGAVGLVVRFRRSRDVERLQLKWFVFAIAGTVITSAILTVVVLVFVPNQNAAWVSWTFNVVLVGGFGIGMPVSCAIAIFKYRLYEIDVVINKTVVYGLLAAFITLVYVGIVVGIGTAIGQGDRPNLGLSILATAVVAVAFQPVRERVQRFANRLVYGKRATPYEVLSDFSKRMTTTYGTEDLLPQMARILADGTGASRAAVWLVVGRELRPEARWPESNGEALHAVELTTGDVPRLSGYDLSVPVRDRGQLLGALSVAKTRGEPLAPTERKLVSDLAAQAGLVLRNVKLIEELRASRQRIVSAQDEERRRIERNIHDGAQQQLVALNVKLGLAKNLASKDAEKTDHLLAQLQSETQDALETLRDLARGIYPPLLRDKGLVAALDAQTRKISVPVEIKADGVHRYSPEVEAGVYFVALEALQNVAKYARASKVTVRLSANGDQLSFEARDDGVGFDPSRTKPGSGLTNMKDRLEALGGSLEVNSTPGGGTSVKGTLSVRAGEPVS